MLTLMESKQIEQLLSKYWQAETTLEDEQALRRYFAQAELPEHLRAYKGLFAWQGADQQAELPLLTNPAEAQKTGGTLRHLASFYLRAAAVVLPLVLAGYLWLSKEPEPTLVTSNVLIIDDPEQALIETRKAFAMMASNMQQAQGEVSELSELNRVNKILKDL